MCPLALSVALTTITAVVGIENGKGLTPPMGWRSWNLYGKNVDQDLMREAMTRIAAREREVDGKLTSLCDLGYCDVGLDDNWQECGQYGKDKFTYHMEDGTPVVNKERFPNLKNLTDYAHSLNLTAGWYFNNCICRDHCGNGQDKGETDPRCYKGDVQALVDYGFDSVKLDNCGAQEDLGLWAELFNKSGHSIMIENCHWGKTVPTKTECPWNFYRTSHDIRANYISVVYNLLTTVKWARQNLSYPGCWAYPDMLEVGCKHGAGGLIDIGLNPAETRTHFGAWCIVSSPLTLSHNLTDEAISNAVWPIISNREAIAVNQAWFGHSGSPFSQSEDFEHFEHPEVENLKFPIALHQYFYKPMSWDGRKFAVLMINHIPLLHSNLTLKFEMIPTLACSKPSYKVRSIWDKEDQGVFNAEFTATRVKPHDSVFLLIECLDES